GRVQRDRGSLLLEVGVHRCDPALRREAREPSRGFRLVTMAERALRMLRPELVAVPRERRDDAPERRRDGLLDLPLPLLEEGEGRGLHPPHGEDVPPTAVARDREEPGEDRAPREVDDLPGGGGGRKPFVQVSEFIKGRDELGARQGGEPRAP